MSQDHYAKLLGDAARSGVYHMPQHGMAGLLAAAGVSGLGIYRVDLAAVRGKGSFFQQMATALEFPDWFGHNWDALADCLSDLSWLPANGYLILLEHCDGFHADSATDFAMALQVFAAAADSWRKEGLPFWVLLDMNASGTAQLQDPA